MSMRSSTRSWHRRLSAAGVLVLLVVSAAACTGATQAPSLTVTEAWVRPPQGMDRPAAAYFEIVGGAVADALLGVTSPAAAMVELHETTTDASGMTGMHPLERLEIPAGETIALQPGGYHLMLMGVTDGAIEVGTTVELRLTFEQAGEIVVQAEVRAG